MPNHLFIIMELASKGFGSPGVLMNERVDLVMAAYDYIKFKSEYETQLYLIRERG